MYFLIFILKVIENAVSTLRMIFVSNGRKYLSALLQLVCSLIWIITTSMVVVNITEDYIKVLFFAMGCTVGSYVGSLLEEKLALGSSMIICISSLDIMDDIFLVLPVTNSMGEYSPFVRNSFLIFLNFTFSSSTACS